MRRAIFESMAPLLCSSEGFPRARSLVASVVSIAACIATAVSCGGTLSNGEAEFHKGHYAEARQAFVASEGESRSWSVAKRAEYALYRGLTHGALGDRAAAGRWLREAKAIEIASPGALSSEDLRRLKLGAEELEVDILVAPAADPPPAASGTL